MRFRYDLGKCGFSQIHVETSEKNIPQKHARTDIDRVVVDAPAKREPCASDRPFCISVLIPNVSSCAVLTSVQNLL